MDMIVDFVMPILAALLIQIAVQFSVERIYIPVKMPKWCFDDLKERDKVNAQKMVSFSPWLKTVFAILAGMVAIAYFVVWLVPAVPMNMGFDPNITLMVFVIPLLFVLSVMLWMFRWIHYNEETFTYRNAIGIKKTFRYEMITEMTVRKRKLHVIADGKRIVFSIAFYGTREFASFAADKIHV